MFLSRATRWGMVTPLPVRGRGARSNASGRFETLSRDGFDDGWGEDPVTPSRAGSTPR